ncbi:MAG TPA: M61 family peptidase [Crocinitomix sp.]|nr:M61 family peptidase [Crocinitomix sp.]
MNYVIQHNATFGQYIKITASFKVNYQEITMLTFPNWRPGRYELANFAKNIKNFNIVGDDNQKVFFNKISANEWEVKTKKVKGIKVTYYYYANELNAGSTYVDDQQLYVNPINCLVYIKAQQNSPCVLELGLPDNRKIASGLPFENNVLKTKNFHQLVDNPFIASSTLQHNSYQLNGITFNIWFQGLVQIDWKKVIDDFIKFSRLQLKKMKGLPVKEYHFIYQILPIKAYHGVEHQNSTVIALGPTYDLMGSLYDDFLGVSAHELYHTWNIKAIRPKEMYPYDYSKPNYSRLGYVAEGVTTYLGDLFLSKSGVKDWKWYKIELEKLLQRHFDNFGRFNYSVAESSWDTWLDGYVQGVPHRKVSIYNEGALLSFILDITIRNNTKNEFSIHDVMRHLYDEYAKKNKGYTEQDFIKIASKFAKEDLTVFFEMYYYSANALEPILTKTIENIGFSLKMEVNPNFTERILGLKTTVSNGITKATLTYPGSPSQMANVLADDEILSINGYKVNNNLHKWVEFFQDSQIVLTISRKGRIIELICPNTNRFYYPKYKLEKQIPASNLSKSTFKKWCGHKWIEA